MSLWKKTATLLLTITLVLPFTGCGTNGGNDSPTSAKNSSLETILEEAREQYDLPALAAVLINDEGIHTASVGTRKYGENIPIGDDGLFHIGSNTKAITATLCGKLVELGKLQWDTTLKEYFEPLGFTVHEEIADVTLLDLLTHRGGIQPFYDAEDEPYAHEVYYEIVTTTKESAQREALARWLLEQPPATTPGEYRYSNGGYSLAGYMAETAGGAELEDLYQNLIFTPLGMEGVSGWPAVSDPSQTYGHLREGETWLIQDPSDPYGTTTLTYRLHRPLTAAGDLSFTPSQYAHFLNEALRGSRGEGSLLQSSTYTTLFTPVGSYAPGWDMESNGNGRIYFHAGSAGLFYAISLLMPEDNRAIAIFTNAATEQSDEILMEVAAKINSL